MHGMDAPTLTRDLFHYDLPADLIAQEPLPERCASRLLVLEGGSGAVSDRMFAELPELLRPGDLLVRNDTRVLPARLRGRKDSGGQAELLFERLLAPRRFLAQMRASKPTPAGRRITLTGGAGATVLAVRDGLIELELDCDVLEYLSAHGEVPLPPYIRRAALPRDRERYQTVFAARPGAVAAPTAGLHFDAPMFERLRTRGVASADLTLHVGAGTFQPLRARELAGHRMHSEWLSVPEATVAQVAACRARAGRVIALGTTVARALETAAAGGALAPYQGETRLFIYPGFQFRVIDALVTNLHLPESTLLMLVAAFAGREQTLAAYRHAVHERYRFFSYGDAMFVTPGGRWS
jgi:S-adenosylmethionine:tRNA ribosyltransferase-isomerase